MKQLVKNELIKLRAQKSYLVLSCVVLAIVILVSFFSSVAITPFMSFLVNGKEFITKSAGYEKVIDYIYDHPDSVVSSVLRVVFKDPKSDGDIMREQAQRYLEYEDYGYYEYLLAGAKFADVCDEHDVPTWASNQYGAELTDLYHWEAMVLGLQEGKYTRQNIEDDYYFESVLSPTFTDFPYFLHYDYNDQTGERRFEFRRVSEENEEGVACEYSEVLSALVARLPECRAQIAQLVEEMIALEPDQLYDALIEQQESEIMEYRLSILGMEETLQEMKENADERFNEYEYSFLEEQIAYGKRSIEDCQYMIGALKALKEQGTNPDSHAYTTVTVLLPEVLTARSRAQVSLDLSIAEEEKDFLTDMSIHDSENKIRVLDEALTVIEYTYRHNLPIEGMDMIDSKATFVNNLSTAAFMITAVVIVLSGMILSREFSTGTIRLWVIRPKTRNKLLASKMVALLIYIVSMMLICFGITYAFGLVNHALDMFFFGQSTFFMSDYAVLFGAVIPIPAILEHLWILIVLTMPVIFFGALCFFESVLAKKGVPAIALGMLLLMFAQNVQTAALVLQNYTGGFGYVLQATVLPYLQMDALLGSSLDYAVHVATGAGLMGILDLGGLLASELYGGAPYICSSIVGVIVLAVHVALLAWASLFVFKRMQIKS